MGHSAKSPIRGMASGPCRSQQVAGHQLRGLGAIEGRQAESLRLGTLVPPGRAMESPKPIWAVQAYCAEWVEVGRCRVVNHEDGSLVLRAVSERAGSDHVAVAGGCLCGPLNEATTARIHALPLEQLEALAVDAVFSEGVALLDFSSPADLAAWLADHKG